MESMVEKVEVVDWGKGVEIRLILFSSIGVGLVGELTCGAPDAMGEAVGLLGLACDLM